jgi:hypothetical protein
MVTVSIGPGMRAPERATIKEVTKIPQRDNIIKIPVTV